MMIKTFGNLSRLIFICAAFFLAVMYLVTAASGETVVPVGSFHEAADAMMAGHYGEAEALFDRFIRENPTEPAGPLMKAAVIHYHSIDYDDFSRSDEFFRLLDMAENLALKKTDEDRDDVWGWYFLYSAWILKAVWSVTSGNFLSGIINARTAVKGMSRIEYTSPTLERCRSEVNNAVFFDTQLTIGSYRFWKSEMTKSIRWLPFIDDQRKQGITEIEEALAKGTLVSPLSSTVLIEILMVYNVKRAIAYSESLAVQYPSCRLFRWQLGESLKRDGRYKDAVRVITGIAEEMANDPEDDGSGPLRCWWKLAVLSESLGRDDDCRRYCGEIIRIGQKKSVYERQIKRIEGARKLLEKLNSD